MKKTQAIIETLILFYKNWFNIKPTVGDRVKVAVGFSSYLNEGIVASVHEDYCWINQYTPSGEIKHFFTASFGYCVFHYLPK